MANRTNVRPRPLDLQKQIQIVRSVVELDPLTGGGKEVYSIIEQRDAEKKAKKKSDIPIPMVRELPTYERDYLPVFKENTTYIRGRGGFGHKDESFVEYDLDSEDLQWLEEFNQGQDRLPPRRLELLIWRLECHNADCNEKHARQGIDKQSPGFVAQIGNMKKEEALQAMSRAHALRHPVLVAVYTYWRQKRANRGKPLLRSLQAPTGTSDPDPFSVFRQPPSPPPCTGPREKMNRPQTRRRRVNDEESLDKMKTLRQNMVKAYEVHEWLTRREARKVQIVYTDTDHHQLLVRQRHEPSHLQAGIEAEYLAQAQTNTAQRPLHMETQSWPAHDTNAATPGSTVPTDLTRFKRRRKDAVKEGVVPISQLPPPPMPPQPEMLFTRQPDLEALGHKLAGAGWRIPEKLRGARPRIGRGGRLIFDRCQAFSGLPFGVDEEPQVEEGSLERASTETDRVGGVKLEPQASGSLPPQPNGIPVGN